MSAYATVEDVSTLWRPLTASEIEQVRALLPLISDVIRSEYNDSTGGNYDCYLVDHPYMASVAKLVTVDVCSRVLRAEKDGDPMTQESQGANGYTWSGTYAIPGGGIANAFMDRDWKRLKVHKQRIGRVEMM